MEQVVSGDGVWGRWSALLVSALVVMGSPGPATVSVAAVGAAFGFGRSLRYMCGLVAGTLGVLLAVAAGLVSLLVSVPGIAPVLLAGTVVYLLYLAFRIATAPPLGDAGHEAEAPTFVAGFLLGLANPKAYLAIAAVFAGSSLPVSPPLAEGMLKTAVLGAVVVLVHLAWLLAGTFLSRILRHPVASRIVNVALAVLLAAAAIGPLMP